MHEVTFAGEASQSKLKRLAEYNQNVDYLIIQELDQIAWLLNLRGSDIEHCPYFFSFVVVEFYRDKYKKGRLYINAKKVPPEIQEYLESLDFELRPYEDFYTSLRDLKGRFHISNGNVETMRNLVQVTTNIYS